MIEHEVCFEEKNAHSRGEDGLIDFAL
jgi:hypothetical protein